MSSNGTDPAGAFFFIIFAVVCGMFTTKILVKRPVIPYAACIFAEGTLVGILHFMDWLPDKNLGSSIDIWVKIDSHVLVFTFLPCLIFGRTAGLTPEYIKGCFTQCLLLAGPGAIFAAFSTAWVAHEILPYGWDWNLCICFGSILVATDPVAISGILHSLGASKILKMQITGESLLNDGVAITILMISWDAMKGNSYYNFWEVLGKFCLLAFGGSFLGTVFGLMTIVALVACADLLAIHDRALQLTITLVCSFASFYFIEQELHCSGLLGTVFAGICIACMGWQQMLDKHIIETVWDMIEFIVNTLIFFQAGTIFGEAVSRRGDRNSLEWSDIGWLCITYICCLLIRGMMVAGLYPILRRVGFSTNWKDATVIWWSSIRGAVGLALAMVVDHDLSRDGGEAGKKNGTLFMFHIGGMAALTLLINGTTSGLLLKHYGMVESNWARLEITKQLSFSLKRSTQCNYKELRKRLIYLSHDSELITKWITALGDEALRNDGDITAGHDEEEMVQAVVKNDVIQEDKLSANISWEDEETAGEQKCVCGNVFKEDSEFCRKCGMPRPEVTHEQRCACGNVFKEDSEFCRQCGMPRPKVEAVASELKAGRRARPAKPSRLQAEVPPDDEDQVRDRGRQQYDDDERKRLAAKLLQATDVDEDTSTYPENFSFCEASEDRRNEIIELVEKLRYLDTARWEDSGGWTPNMQGLQGKHHVDNSGQACDGLLAISSVRILLYSMLRAYYCERIETGALPRNSRVMTLMLSVVEAGEAHSNVPICDVVHLLRSTSFATTWGWKPSPKWARILRDARYTTVTGKYYVPIRRGNAMFDLYTLISVMDAHGSVQASIRNVLLYKSSPDDMRAIVNAVVAESKQQVELMKKFLSMNRVDTSFLILVRTQQLAQELLRKSEEQVHQWVKIGALVQKEADDLLEETFGDHIKVWITGSVSPDGSSHWWNAPDTDLPLQMPLEVWKIKDNRTEIGDDRMNVYNMPETYKERPPFRSSLDKPMPPPTMVGGAMAGAGLRIGKSYSEESYNQVSETE